MRSVQFKGRIKDLKFSNKDTEIGPTQSLNAQIIEIQISDSEFSVLKDFREQIDFVATPSQGVLRDDEESIEDSGQMSFDFGSIPATPEGSD